MESYDKLVGRFQDISKEKNSPVSQGEDLAITYSLQKKMFKGNMMLLH